MRARFPHMRTDRLATQLQRSAAAVSGRAQTLGLHKSVAYLASPDACRLRRDNSGGIPFRFKPGQVPANKGLRRPGYAPGRMAQTQFKKGQSTNAMPVGSTRLVDGYIYRKVSDIPLVCWTRNWVVEHVRVWTEAHGPLPPNHVVAFKNGNRADIRLDNLVCLSRRENMRRNSIHNLPPELANTIQLIGALNRQIRRRENRAEKQDR